MIHPAQIDTAKNIFTPSAETVAHARRVLEALSQAEAGRTGAVQLDGQMLDEALAIAARRLLVKRANTNRRQEPNDCVVVPANRRQLCSPEW